MKPAEVILWTDRQAREYWLKEAYQNLKAGMNKPEALRVAQIRVRDMAASEFCRVIEKAN